MVKKNYSILYAEDDPLTRENFIVYLKQFFSKVYEASDGKEALSIYKDKKPDIIIVDVRMPKLDGLDLIKDIRQNDNNTPIIVITAHSDRAYLFEAIKLNLTDYLVKPINIKEFNSVLEETIEKLDNKSSINLEDNIIKITKACYWDKRKRILFYKDKIVEFTKNERLLFELLLKKKNEIVEPSEIVSYIWNNKDKDAINDASIRNLVKRVRKKTPVDIIKSIYGSGYIISY